MNKLKPPQILSSEDWPAELSSIAKDMKGHPINIHKLMANNPELLQAWWSFRNHSVQGGSLGQANAELVILRVAVHMQSWYEWASHVDRAIQVGIDKKHIFALLEVVEKNPWTPQESSLIVAVDELVADRRISEDTLGLLSRDYSNKQIMDLIAIHGMYLTLAAMLNTWDVALDSETLKKISPITEESQFLAAARKFNAQV